MIRDRRSEDLGRLCEVLRGLDGYPDALAPQSPEEWLTEMAAECSWVFDQAPVSVVPTRNVVGHVQVYRPPEAPWVVELAARTGRQPTDLLLVGHLFVAPVKHSYGIARYLLGESANYIEGRGCLPVLDPVGAAFVPHSLPARLGFVACAAGDGTRTVLARITPS